MHMVTASVDNLLRHWRRQILAHRDPKSIDARRGFAAVSILDQANTSAAFVDIDRLFVVLLYEDEYHSADDSPSARIPLRLAGYRVSRVPHGVEWGGVANSALFKDLMLRPQFGARGQRIDCCRPETLALALKLDGRLSRAARHPAAPWRPLQLPRLWAGFRSKYVSDLSGEGPEFELACRQAKLSSIDLWRKFTQHSDGLTLFPLDWISGKLERATLIFAERTCASRRQVCRIDAFLNSLTGFQGACAYDFYSSRFRSKGCRTDSRLSAEVPMRQRRPQRIAAVAG